MFILKRKDNKSYTRSLPRKLGLPQGVKPIPILSGTPGLTHPAISLTRNTKGSRWDPNGNNELIDADEWRYNYNPLTGTYEGRTIMGQWTNEILDPRDMTTGNWGGSATATRDQTGIDGQTNTACLLKDDSTSSTLEKDQSITIPNDSNTHTAVIFLEKDNDESRFPEYFVRLLGGTQVQIVIQINTKTGATTTRASSDTVSSNVTDRGTHWEVSVTLTNNGTGNTSLEYYLRPAMTTNFGSVEASATGSIVADVASVFLNRSSPPPTPVYGETAGQSYTQDPDMADVSTLADIDYNPDESTFVIGFNSAYSEGTLFDLHSDGSNRIYAHRNASNEIHLVIVDGGTTQADLNLGTIADNTQGKIAVGWKENDIAGCLNGGTVQTDTTATIPSVTTLNIGRDYNDTNYWGAFIGSKLSYPRKLTNSQIQNESK